MITKKKARLGALATAAALFLSIGQAQAQTTYFFGQNFDIEGFNGLLSGSFSAFDANGDTVFDTSEMTFLSLNYVGTAGGLGFVSLAFTPPAIVAEGVINVTNWFPSDRTLGDGLNGFYLEGRSTTGHQIVWTAGPGNAFDYGNTPSLNTGGDPQNQGPLAVCPTGTGLPCRFGALTIFDISGNPLETARSDEYAVVAIPEPSTYLMMLGGVAALALRARRRAA